MKLEFIADVSDPLVRLYDFDAEGAKLFHAALRNWLEPGDGVLEVSELKFVTAVNCTLSLEIGEERGIVAEDEGRFRCELPKKSYVAMLALIGPFLRESNGYQWLYDLNSGIEFLFSPKGNW